MLLCRDTQYNTYTYMLYIEHILCMQDTLFMNTLRVSGKWFVEVRWIVVSAPGNNILFEWMDGSCMYLVECVCSDLIVQNVVYSYIMGRWRGTRVIYVPFWRLVSYNTGMPSESDRRCLHAGRVLLIIPHWSTTTHRLMFWHSLTWNLLQTNPHRHKQSHKQHM